MSYNVVVTIDRGTGGAVSNTVHLTGTYTLTPTNGVARLDHNQNKTCRFATFLGPSGTETLNWKPVPGSETTSISVYINEAATYTVNLILY